MHCHTVVQTLILRNMLIRICDDATVPAFFDLAAQDKTFDTSILTRRPFWNICLHSTRSFYDCTVFVDWENHVWTKLSVDLEAKSDRMQMVTCSKAWAFSTTHPSKSRGRNCWFSNMLSVCKPMRSFTASCCQPHLLGFSSSIDINSPQQRWLQSSCACTSLGYRCEFQ